MWYPSLKMNGINEQVYVRPFIGNAKCFEDDLVCWAYERESARVVCQKNDEDFS